MADSVTKSPSLWASLQVDQNDIPWLNGHYTYASDNNRASLQQMTTHYSQRLVVKKFEFNIPVDAVILGVVVEIERCGLSGTHTKESEVYLTKDGESPVGTNKAQTDVEWPTEGDEIASYGSSTDLWGTNWTPEEINSEQFGVILRMGQDSRPLVDHIQVTVYYTTWEPSENQPLNLTAQVVAV